MSEMNANISTEKNAKDELNAQVRKTVIAWLDQILPSNNYRLINNGSADAPSKDYALEVTNTTDADLREIRVNMEIFKDGVKVDEVTAKTGASGIKSGEKGQLAFFTKHVNFSTLKILSDTVTFKSDWVPKTVMKTEQQDSKFRRKKKVSEEFRVQTSGLLKNKGDEYVSKLGQLRDAAQDPEIKAGLNMLVPVIEKIFARVKEVPGSETEIKRLTDRYLPMIINSTESYLSYAGKDITGDDMEDLRNEVISGLKLINEASENLLNRLYEDGIVDASTDISVLKMLLKQDGLLESDILKE